MLIRFEFQKGNYKAFESDLVHTPAILYTFSQALFLAFDIG